MASNIRIEDIDRPEPAAEGGDVYGSDAIAETLRRIGLRYLALNPGASYRGLHDSIVNRNGNRAPQMLLCLHEEHAVAIAQGYAKITGEPMGVALHSNVGLLHGSMGIFNAFIDRMPMVVLGATGPVDAAKRRPWIDWIHTAQDQGALIRPFIKWDDQPASVTATIEALFRANLMARTAPAGPTYVCLDATVQEQKLDKLPPVPSADRFQPPPPPHPAPDLVTRAVEWLRAAKRPVILAGRCSRSELAWRRRVALAEKLDAKVCTDLKIASNFPTNHPLHVGAPGYFLDAPAAEVLKQADVVLSLDWIDLAGTFKRAGGEPDAKIILASIEHHNHNGWSKDHQALPPVDLHLTAPADIAVVALCAALGITDDKLPQLAVLPTAPRLLPPAEAAALDIDNLAAALGEGLGDAVTTFLRLPLGWDGALWHFRHPLDYMGGDGGGGVGSGPGTSIGGALALADANSERLPVAVIGDGDYMMGSSAIWTAAHYRIPLLFVIANNNSFFNDEVHQERVAKDRGRPPQNRWVGQRISDPDIDLAAIGRAQGAHGIGPVRTTAELAAAVREGVGKVRQGQVVVIDARVRPGYSQAMATSLVRKD